VVSGSLRPCSPGHYHRIKTMSYSRSLYSMHYLMHYCATWNGPKCAEILLTRLLMPVSFNPADTAVRHSIVGEMRFSIQRTCCFNNVAAERLEIDPVHINCLSTWRWAFHRAWFLRSSGMHFRFDTIFLTSLVKWQYILFNLLSLIRFLPFLVEYVV